MTATLRLYDGRAFGVGETHGGKLGLRCDFSYLYLYTYLV
jgi:hypothetical protein